MTAPSIDLRFQFVLDGGHVEDFLFNTTVYIHDMIALSIGANASCTFAGGLHATSYSINRAPFLEAGSIDALSKNVCLGTSNLEYVVLGDRLRELAWQIPRIERSRSPVSAVFL